MFTQLGGGQTNLVCVPFFCEQPNEMMVIRKAPSLAEIETSLDQTAATEKALYFGTKSLMLM